MTKAISLLLVIFLAACARAPVKQAREAMRLTKAPEQLGDDLNYDHLKSGLKANIAEILKSQRFTGDMVFGSRSISRPQYAESLKFLLETLEKDKTGALFKQAVQEHFEFYEIYGQKEWGEVFVTSYYDPVIKGSTYKTKKFTQAIYKTPKDLVNVDLGAYFERFPKLNVLEDVLEQKSRDQTLRGRIVSGNDSSEVSRIVPYFDRKEIDEEQKLNGQKLEMAWVDPIEAFFLQIQGSGTIELSNGRRLRVGYHSQNGHPYKAIGKELFHVIPLEEMSLQRIEAYLRTLSVEEQSRILSANPSYVFFQKLKGDPIGYFGTEVVPGRTIATDTRYFPKGALAYLEYERPEFTSQDQEAPVAWKKSQRFVLDQDTGGAIRGPHRLDLYWGRGDEAKQVAGVMKNWGRLYYLIPKEDFLKAQFLTSKEVQ